MKLKEYARTKGDKVISYLGNRIFCEFNEDEFNMHIEALGELEIKNIEKSFFFSGHQGIHRRDIVYVDEHEVKRILLRGTEWKRRKVKHAKYF